MTVDQCILKIEIPLRPRKGWMAGVGVADFAPFRDEVDPIGDTVISEYDLAAAYRQFVGYGGPYISFRRHSRPGSESSVSVRVRTHVDPYTGVGSVWAHEEHGRMEITFLCTSRDQSDADRSLRAFAQAIEAGQVSLDKSRKPGPAKIVRV